MIIIEWTESEHRASIFVLCHTILSLVNIIWYTIGCSSKASEVIHIFFWLFHLFRCCKLSKKCAIQNYFMELYITRRSIQCTPGSWIYLSNMKVIVGQKWFLNNKTKYTMDPGWLNLSQQYESNYWSKMIFEQKLAISDIWAKKKH